VPAAVAVELALDGTADVVELERLRSLDGEPNHVAISFLPAAL
jgi:GntR family transcriptional regulator